MKKVLKNNKAITLIALVITIVVLIILAAVAINLSLGNNGIFNRAKTAKEQYQNAQEYEEMEVAKTTNQIDSYVDGHRGTVTLTDEEYALFKSQFSKNGNVSISKPHTWNVGTEYDFGDGLYGQRFTGTITASANNWITVTLLPAGSSAINIINWGGQFYYMGNQAMSIGTTWENCNYNSGLDNMTPNGNALNFGSKSGQTRTNAPYEIWIIYSK